MACSQIVIIGSLRFDSGRSAQVEAYRPGGRG
jgi:hypothetical protein